MKPLTIKECIAKLHAEPSIGVAEAGIILGLSRNGAYAAAKRGDLGVPTFWAGGRLKVASQAMLERLGLAAPAIGENAKAAEIMRAAEEITRTADRQRFLRIAKRLLAEAEALVREIEGESAAPAATPPRPARKPRMMGRLTLPPAEVFRLFDQEGWTLDRIGKKAGVTRERIRQVVDKYRAEQEAEAAP
jgi:hypothetical protein